MEVFWDILRYTIPALVVFFTAYVMIKSFMEKEYRIRQIELKFTNQKDALPMRLHAYERLSLFLERISFNNLIQRVRKSDMSSKEFQYVLISNIRMEYEHNLSQQIYVSAELWNMITLCKDEMIKIVNLVSASLPPDASSGMLSKAIFEFLIETEQVLPTQKAIHALKDEVKTIY